MVAVRGCHEVVCVGLIGVGIGGARGAMAPPKIVVKSVY